MLLDYCDYYFDGELQEKDGYVLNICERANALERAVTVQQNYHVKVNHIPKELFLVCETPEKFAISVNALIKPVYGCLFFEIFQMLKIGWKQNLSTSPV